MCRCMVDIQSATAEIRRGKKKEERRKKETAGQKYNGLPALFHTAAITSGQSNLTTGRIAAAHGRFSGIRKVATVCTPPNTSFLGPSELKT